MLVMIDLDNTLVDRASVLAAWAEGFCTRLGLPEYSSDWILEQDRDGYANRQEVFDGIRSKFELSEPVETLLEAYRHEIVERSVLLPGAVDCLEELRSEGHTLVIVSNGSSQQQFGKVDRLDLRTLVDDVVVSDAVGLSKPDAAIFALAAERVGNSLAEAWMVGDAPEHDVLGAARIGVRTAWLRRGRRWDEREASPTVEIDALAELPGALRSELAGRQRAQRNM